MTTDWRHPDTLRIESCPQEFMLQDAFSTFHDYGVLWLRDRIDCYVDRKPVIDIKRRSASTIPAHDRQSGDGREIFQSVGFVDAESPNPVAFEIDRVSVYQIDSC